MLGIVTVALDIRQKRKDFGLPGLIDAFSKWLSQSPLSRNSGGVSAPLRGLTMNAEGGHFALKGCPANASTEDRIRALEGNVVGLDQEIRGAVETIRHETTAREVAIREERVARESEDTKIREKLAVSQTGGLHLSAVGILWLAVGTVLGTISQELAQRLR
ncbi:MAG: hypothetical protein ABI408_09970 [Gemmatimonadaceae bacterium]